MICKLEENTKWLNYNEIREMIEEGDKEDLHQIMLLFRNILIEHKTFFSTNRFRLENKVKAIHEKLIDKDYRGARGDLKKFFEEQDFQLFEILTGEISGF